MTTIQELRSRIGQAPESVYTEAACDEIDHLRDKLRAAHERVVEVAKLMLAKSTVDESQSLIVNLRTRLTAVEKEREEARRGEERNWDDFERKALAYGLLLANRDAIRIKLDESRRHQVQLEEDIKTLTDDRNAYRAEVDAAKLERASGLGDREREARDAAQKYLRAEARLAAELTELRQDKERLEWVFQVLTREGTNGFGRRMGTVWCTRDMPAFDRACFDEARGFSKKA